MKTLVNKHNPKIKVIAPEIKVNTDTQTFYIGDEMFDMDNWILVDEDQSGACTKDYIENWMDSKIKRNNMQL